MRFSRRTNGPSRRANGLPRRTAGFRVLSLDREAAGAALGDFRVARMDLRVARMGWAMGHVDRSLRGIGGPYL